MYKGFTLEELESKFYYNKEKGQLIWKSPHRFEGKVAGSPIESNGGYRYIGTSIDGKQVSLLAHRVIWFLHYKEPASEDKVIDHINGDPDDNRIENLRVVTHKDNSRNKKKRKKKVNQRYVLTSVPGIKFDKKEMCYVVSSDNEELGRTMDFDDAKYMRWGWEFENDYHISHGVK